MSDESAVLETVPKQLFIGGQWADGSEGTLPVEDTATEETLTEVADASPVPVLLYNVTMFTGVTIQVEAVERLALHPNIVGMKESGSDIGYISELVSRTPDDFTLLAGSATTYFHALCSGCDGGILALAGCSYLGARLAAPRSVVRR